MPPSQVASCMPSLALINKALPLQAMTAKVTRAFARHALTGIAPDGQGCICTPCLCRQCPGWAWGICMPCLCRHCPGRAGGHLHAVPLQAVPWMGMGHLHARCLLQALLFQAVTQCGPAATFSPLKATCRITREVDAPTAPKCCSHDACCDIWLLHSLLRPARQVLFPGLLGSPQAFLAQANLFSNVCDNGLVLSMLFLSHCHNMHPLVHQIGLAVRAYWVEWVGVLDLNFRTSSNGRGCSWLLMGGCSCFFIDSKFAFLAPLCTGTRGLRQGFFAGCSHSSSSSIAMTSGRNIAGMP